MHIPDGYLSPVTALVMFLLVLPFWVIGLRKIRQTVVREDNAQTRGLLQVVRHLVTVEDVK